MLDKVYVSISGVSYSKDLSHLRNDVMRTKEKYNSIAQTLSTIRSKLIALRNDKEDIEREISLLKNFDRRVEENIISLNKCICPLCKTDLDDTVDLRISHYNTADDIILLSSDRQISLKEIEKSIDNQEKEYIDWLAKLNEYEREMNMQSSEVNDVLRHKGFVEIRDNLADELHKTRTTLDDKKKAEKEIKKKLREYDDKKAQINKKYYELMVSDKNSFGLEEVDAKSFEKITNTFSAGGSNKPIATIMWYINLIRIKNLFAPKTICFPIVFDSPNNAETDISKKIMIYKYLCDRVDEKNQLIVSGIGYNPKDFDGMDFDKVITLENAKYELLCEQDYTDNFELLHTLNKN